MFGFIKLSLLALILLLDTAQMVTANNKLSFSPGELEVPETTRPCDSTQLSYHPDAKVKVGLNGYGTNRLLKAKRSHRNKKESRAKKAGNGNNLNVLRATKTPKMRNILTPMPSTIPSDGPTVRPTASPSSSPTTSPSSSPSTTPTSSPSTTPSSSPTTSPTSTPTTSPTSTPTTSPTSTPTTSPSSSPTTSPSSSPTTSPSSSPTTLPSSPPTILPPLPSSSKPFLETINFDESGSGTTCANPSIQFQNCYIVTGVDKPKSGFDYGTVSQPNVGYNGNGLGMTMSCPGGQFTLISLCLTPAWGKVTVHLDGYVNGESVTNIPTSTGTRSNGIGITLELTDITIRTCIQPKLILKGMDELQIITSDKNGGTGQYSEVAIDNMVIEITKECHGIKRNLSMNQ